MIRAIVEGLYWVTVGAGVAAGLYAAKLSGKSANVTHAPCGDGVVQSGEPIGALMQRVDVNLQTAIETAALNRKAARWTAYAVLLGLAATVLDHIHLH